MNQPLSPLVSPSWPTFDYRQESRELDNAEKVRIWLSCPFFERYSWISDLKIGEAWNREFMTGHLAQPEWWTCPGQSHGWVLLRQKKEMNVLAAGETPGAVPTLSLTGLWYKVVTAIQRQLVLFRLYRSLMCHYKVFHNAFFFIFLNHISKFD
jgi:hypothetical protein